MTYPILRPRSVWTTFMQGLSMGGVGGEGVASGEGGSGWVREWRMEIFFVFFLKKKNKKQKLSFNGSKTKTNKKRKCETKIKNPLPEDFFLS